MKQLLGAVCAVAAAISGASAQNSFPDALVTNPGSAISNFDIPSLGPILNELGVVWQQIQDGNGNPAVQANAGGQLIFYLQPTACRSADARDCIGLATFAYFEGPTNAQTVRAFNDSYAFVSTGLTASSGGAYISRYDIADYGVPRGNVANSILNFLALADRLRSELETASQTVSLEGYAADLSSVRLNRDSLTKLTGVEVVSRTLIERHQRGFEESLEQFLILSADNTLPRNKIENLSTK